MGLVQNGNKPGKEFAFGPEFKLLRTSPDWYPVFMSSPYGNPNQKLALVLISFSVFFGIIAWFSLFSNKSHEDRDNPLIPGEGESTAEKLEKDYFFHLGTASTGGAYFLHGQLFEKLTETPNQLGKPIKAHASSGSYENIEKILEGEFQLAFCELRALEDSARISPEIRGEIFIIAVLWSEKIQILYSNPKGSEKPDLKTLLGKEIPAGLARSGTQNLFYLLGLSFGLTPKPLSLPFDKAGIDLLDGKISAAFFTGATPMAVVSQLLTQKKASLYPFSPEEQQILQQKFSFLKPALIDQKDYNSLSMQFPTLSHPNVLICRKDFPKGEVGHLLNLLKTHNLFLHSQSPNWKEVKLSFSPELGWPLHPEFLSWAAVENQEKRTETPQGEASLSPVIASGSNPFSPEDLDDVF